jgi:meiosis-specific transcription factor NDT80
VDSTGGKNIELIQHTPKRDKGPPLAMKKKLLAPTPPGKSHEYGNYGPNSFHQSSHIAGPSLPLQTEAESSEQYAPTSHANSNYQHAFERI